MRTIDRAILTALLLGAAFLVLGAKFGEDGITAAGVASVALAIFWAVRDEHRAATTPARSDRPLPDEFWGACGTPGCSDCMPLFDRHNNPIAGWDR